MRRTVEAVRSGVCFTPERVRRYALVLFGVELAFFLFCVAGTHGWLVTLGEPCSSDFVSFYAAGRLTDEGVAALAYDRAAHHAAEQAATEAGIGYNFFFYPPVFLLVCAGLARLPYLVAFVAFQLGTAAPCLLLVRRIAPAVPIVAAAAFPAVFWTAGTGQNAFLTAALLAGATLTLTRWPVLAGCLFGAVCYKPHLGLLMPVALIAGGHWRAAGAAALAVAGLVAASGTAFGWESWGAFLASRAAAGAAYGLSDGGIDLAGATSPFGLVLALGGGFRVAAGLQAVAVAGAAAAVGWAWRGRVPFAAGAAVLLAAIPIAAPVGMFYDLVLTGVAAAWLVRDGGERGFPPWQRCGLAVLFVAPLLSGNLGPGQIGVPPAAAALGFGLALRQAAVGRRAVADGPASAGQVSSSSMPGSALAMART